MLGLDPASLSLTETVETLAGNRVPQGVRSYAQCYGGHQFGSWAGQLGDGRAIALGEVEGQEACENEVARRSGGAESPPTYEIQLKGVGQTPYSRFADGRAILFSSLREFVASEAMAALGVPTTRALSLVATGDQVLRDRMYDGNPAMEPGAVVARVARSFVRIGSFELPASRGGEESELVKAFADHVIGRHYPHLFAGAEKSTISQGKDLADGLETAGNPYEGLVLEVARRTGKLAAEWERVGFVHGVLNTDNMSIVGETIDYGPYGFLERFDPRFTPNVTDMPGRRYCFA
ncbi:YdiU/UPF0061 hypothetical protein [Helicosporidium sp. ATCC 50920]|nr:YdiU/UPF0061 hypothetical protein [Helicosporidium sp. ATCC 50920]|eukprot:KDD74562.1 YdiU/UPF0061 hypothetical protein [Helicosporidium sp. ATCC 50920]